MQANADSWLIIQNILRHFYCLWVITKQKRWYSSRNPSNCCQMSKSEMTAISSVTLKFHLYILYEITKSTRDWQEAILKQLGFAVGVQHKVVCNYVSGRWFLGDSLCHLYNIYAIKGIIGGCSQCSNELFTHLYIHFLMKDSFFVISR